MDDVDCTNIGVSRAEIDHFGHVVGDRRCVSCFPMLSNAVNQKMIMDAVEDGKEAMIEERREEKRGWSEGGGRRREVSRVPAEKGSNELMTEKEGANRTFGLWNIVHDGHNKPVPFL